MLEEEKMKGICLMHKDIQTDFLNVKIFVGTRFVDEILLQKKWRTYDKNLSSEQEINLKNYYTEITI